MDRKDRNTMPEVKLEAMQQFEKIQKKAKEVMQQLEEIQKIAKKQTETIKEQTETIEEQTRFTMELMLENTELRKQLIEIVAEIAMETVNDKGREK